MQRPLFSLITVCVLVAACLPGAAQKFLPKSIHFKGDPEYSDQELLAASGLKAGVPITPAELGDHSKQLMNTGVFENIYYRLEGPDLVITVTPGQNLYPVRIDNRLPLYHGKVPSQGTLLDDVRAMLQEMLATQGIKVTVTSTPFATPGKHDETSINFAIVSPEVRVGEIRIDGVSPEIQAKIKRVADRSVGKPFEFGNSEKNLELAFEAFYAEEGYAAAKVHAARSGDPVVKPEAIGVPFSVSVEEGRLYKLGAVHLPPNALVTQDEIDKAAAARGESAEKWLTLQTARSMIESRYKSKGYLDYTVTSRPQIDEAAGTVSYTMEIDPGPVYHLAFVKFDNVSDDLRKLLMRNWQMFPGDPFDGGYVGNFVMMAQKADPVLMRSLAGVKATFDVQADPETHQVNCVIRFEKVH